MLKWLSEFGELSGFERIIRCCRIEINPTFHLLLPRRIRRNIPARSTSTFLSQFAPSAALFLFQGYGSTRCVCRSLRQWPSWRSSSPGLRWLSSVGTCQESPQINCFCEKQLEIAFPVPHKKFVLFYLITIAYANVWITLLQLISLEAWQYFFSVYIYREGDMKLMNKN